MPPEDDPMLDQPADREEYDAAMAVNEVVTPDGEVVDAEFTVTPEVPYSHKKLFELQDNLRRAEAGLEVAKENVKYAKAAVDAAVQAIDAHITDMRQLRLPFAEPDQPSGPDGWRDLAISEALVGLTPGILSAFVDASLGTMGDLQDFLESGELTDIDGLGESKAEAVKDAMEKFWADWHQKHPAQQELVDEDQPE